MFCKDATIKGVKFVLGEIFVGGDYEIKRNKMYRMWAYSTYMHIQCKHEHSKVRKFKHYKYLKYKFCTTKYPRFKYMYTLLTSLNVSLGGIHPAQHGQHKRCRFPGPALTLSNQILGPITRHRHKPSHVQHHHFVIFGG